MLTPHGEAECCTGASLEAINSACLCLPLEADERRARVAAGSRDQRLEGMLANRRGLYAATPVFLSHAHYQQMAKLVAAVAQSTETEAYRRHIEARDSRINLSRRDRTHSLLMGFDFHISPDGPRLIVINTNAGAAFLARQFADAGSGCLPAAVSGPDLTEARLDELLVNMFLEEWGLARPGEPLRSLAIVDAEPEAQYLYPDMVLAAELLNSNGIHTIIADPSELDCRDGKLWRDGEIIDMVYNRLTDFRLEAPQNHALRLADDQDAVVLSPSPRHHALYADKRNLMLLGDENGAPGAVSADLRAMIPLTRPLRGIDQEAAWKARRTLFFKPADGYGSRAAYRGDKLTRSVWASIRQGDYVAQALVPPAMRGLMHEGQPARLKYDLRLYAYAGNPLFPVARMYRGQTTNFRTPGGGLAPVILV